MYDKIKIVIPKMRDIPDVSKYLSKGVQLTDIVTGETNTFGYLDGLKVAIFMSTIHITGSLSKFIYPNNIYPLDRHTTKEAVQKLSDNLHLDATKARITGLEYGTQFVMKQPPTAYLSLLGDMPRLMRQSISGQSLYYKQTGIHPVKEFVFYDKIADAKVKGMDIPIGFEDANLLKYEMRLKGRLPQQLNISEVTASTLYDKEFYRLLMKRYQESYFSITKIKRLKDNSMEQIKTVTDALNVLFARLISQSNPDEIDVFLDDLKRANVFNDKKYYTRLKNRIKDAIKKGGATVPDDLIKELDDEIKNVGAYI